MNEDWLGMEKVKFKRPSLRKAINEKCKECIYDPLSGLGTWKQQVGGCTSTDCPLYCVRPLPDAKKENNDVGKEDFQTVL